MAQRSSVRLDSSQSRFCSSTASHLRLLAPAGCGKTLSLLYRCLEIAKRARGSERFLIVTFTKVATEELRQRLAFSPRFARIRDAVTVSTLNAYGFRRMRTQLNHTQLLTTAAQRHFAVWNQLNPIWKEREHISAAIAKNRNRTRPLMAAMDELKNLGFDHTTDTNYDLFRRRLSSLKKQCLYGHMERQLDALTKLRILDAGRSGDDESASTSVKAYYDRFFTFWRDAVSALHSQNTFTFDDQKYWCWLDLRSPGPDGRKKPPVSGAARYAHVLVDEFQDISPLDLALIRTIVERHRATLTIVGDDDQAIFEWRGASPEYILKPDLHFKRDFETHILSVNYRSPKNIVDHSQQLIKRNRNREPKQVSSVSGAAMAQIEVRRVGTIDRRLEVVSELARTAGADSIGVIGRVRSQLIPYEVYYASDGGPVRMATDLDVFASSAFEDLMRLLEIWRRGHNAQRPTRAVEDALAVCNLIKRYPLRKQDRDGLSRHLREGSHRSCSEAVTAIGDYAGAPLSGKTHDQLCELANIFVMAGTVSEAVTAVHEHFRGLRFDFEKAEDDIWYTDPPLKQLATMAAAENMDADDLIGRLDAAKERLQHWQGFEDDLVRGQEVDRPLHLMTAPRAKGKEFDTVVVLECVDGFWPHKHAKTTAEKEAERRLFYVAFTRARKRLVLLAPEEVPLSPFIGELGLPKSVLAGT